MFQFFKRVKTYVGSELNAALDKAEDPVKMLEQFMREMSMDIRDAETAVAKQLANEKMLKKKYDDANSMVEKRQQQAVKALEAENEELARRALEDKQNHAKQADSLKQAHEQAAADATALRGQLAEMKREYEEMELKQDSLKARAESAKTRTKINRTMSSVGGDESRRGFDRMEEKVMQFEAEAETSEDLRAGSRSLDDEFASLNKNSAVDDELAALKKQYGKE
ncbi:PspA/IM30 family protein [Planococcus sp. CP5-4]|uniref:PspA/IM30 family protein n=1 Tax=unclassified Planococcus (in: firmicutes) TaxID=2662419 RepID=UPI001C221295|nr:MULTISPECIES: PspA/IM30 family protein [unclassified Planococcus (in: firmicutes)]MBU9671856.1 PspA/IM30 family protein [Planococcus sp. CP5-4_YE]MBV0909176.1 PspA/IM30 family protein [Planococcus sp. CP5-4_UN]MBW6063668.1 PspA/IM30 family protein [Planococcus sp. CP5-4]